MGIWLKHNVITKVKAPLDNVWHTWSDLDSMPLWMSWIESVKTIDQKTSTLPDITEWTLAANGFKFRWKAKITERIDRQKLIWESIGGLPTKGSVLFSEENSNVTLVNLSVTYELPKMIARIMEENILGKMVTNELQANLDRFRDLVESNYKNES
ncbi:MAG: hypothetical protein CMK49_02050 [Prochlorococcus sp. SP3034]|nr:hypothetical protein [Prochlorococcus sp. SP3034]|tara:strand:+ start:7969 stop:8433 length:465 start_codon:yes stop_codon:yes gene_type:complete